eukprot:6045882-Prymnesium_polylepis.1
MHAGWRAPRGTQQAHHDYKLDRTRVALSPSARPLLVDSLFTRASRRAPIRGRLPRVASDSPWTRGLAGAP